LFGKLVKMAGRGNARHYFLDPLPAIDGCRGMLDAIAEIQSSSAGDYCTKGHYVLKCQVSHWFFMYPPRSPAMEPAQVTLSDTHCGLRRVGEIMPEVLARYGITLDESPSQENQVLAALVDEHSTAHFVGELNVVGELVAS